MPHICVNAPDQHWFRLWLVACSASSHYLNQPWLIVNWTLRNRLDWNFNQNIKLFINKKCIWKCRLRNGRHCGYAKWGAKKKLRFPRANQQTDRIWWYKYLRPKKIMDNITKMGKVHTSDWMMMKIWNTNISEENIYIYHLAPTAASSSCKMLKGTWFVARKGCTRKTLSVFYSYL